MHSAAKPFAHTAGPNDASVVFVGEAFGEQEERFLPWAQPFVGESGKELFRMLFESWSCDPELEAQCLGAMRQHGNGWVSLRDLWLRRASILCTNVLALRPPNNKLEALCTNKAEAGNDYQWPAIQRALYLRSEYLPEVSRLFVEIKAHPRTLIVALGNTACWALLRSTSISSIRGVVCQTNLGVKLLPTYHPAGVLRNWAWRPIVVFDLMKAHREAKFPEIRRPKRTVLTNPTLDEIENWYEVEAKRAKILSVDIETGAGQIKCIGFASRRDCSIVIPFVDLSKPGGSYWDSFSDELLAWGHVRRLLDLPCPKLGQNFLYDLQYLVRMGLRPRNCGQDTMLLHHSLFPELQKGLGFLGSIYTDEASWKLMRKRRKEDSEKRDE